MLLIIIHIKLVNSYRQKICGFCRFLNNIFWTFIFGNFQQKYRKTGKFDFLHFPRFLISLQPLSFFFFFFGTVYRAAEELITGSRGAHRKGGENNWDARYLRIDFVPSFESECAGTGGVVQVKPRTRSHFNQVLGHKLNSTPPPEERWYDEQANAITPSITEQLYELASL